MCCLINFELTLAFITAIMIKEFITGIWLAKFENAAQLEEYVSYNYGEKDDDPNCKFADDIGLRYLDTDFLESIFLDSSSKIIQRIKTLSFVGNFQSELLASVNSLKYDSKNSIISVSGIRDGNPVNIGLFDLTPGQNDNGDLLFVGLYKFAESH
jgi:hypothetical protein